MIPISLLSSTLQFCDWYAVKNIKKRLVNKGYSQEVRKEIVTARDLQRQVQETIRESRAVMDDYRARVQHARTTGTYGMKGGYLREKSEGQDPCQERVAHGSGDEH